MVYDWLLLCLFAYFLWNIWKSKCKSRFDAAKMNSDHIIRVVPDIITLLYDAYKLCLEKADYPDVLPNIFQISKVFVSSHKVTSVRWLSPPLNLLN